MAWEHYDLPFINVSGETIPPFAVMQFNGWTTGANGQAVFNARKPNGAGKAFLVNGPTSVAPPSATQSGMGLGTVHRGALALFDEELSPQVDQELGPVPNQWHLGEGAGFFVVGDVQGSGSSPPGFPAIPSTFRVRVVMQAVALPDNIIIGTVSSNFSAGAPQFVIINIQVLEGPDPRTDPGNPLEGVAIENVPAEDRTAGETVKAKKNVTTGKWFPDLTAEGSSLIYAELTEDKGYQDANKLAKPVLPNGTIDAAAQEFWLVDLERRFYGLKAYSDASGGMTHKGYRYFAELFDEDFEDTGKPGYRIIDGEGPADFLIVTLVGNVSGTGATDCNFNKAIHFGGGPESDRVPRIESAGFDFQVYNTINAADGALAGERWAALWDRENERYVFCLPLAPTTTSGALFLTNTTVPARSYSAPKLTPGHGAGYLFVDQEDGTWDFDTGQSMDLYNSSSTSVLSGRIVQAKMIDGKWFIDVDDC